MFGKAARFPAEKPSDVPPPGYYNPKSPDTAPYKRSGFLEKSDRRLFDNIPDGPGPSDYQSLQSDVKSAKPQARRVSVTTTAQEASLRQQIQELLAENARLAKDRKHEVQRAESKVEHAEARIKELVRDKGMLQTEATTAAKEQRLAQERESAVRAALDKAESQVKQFAERASKYTALQRRLEELEKLHSESKSKSRKAAGSLETDLEQARELASERQKQLDLLRSQRDPEERRMQELKKAHANAEKDNQDLRAKLQALQASASAVETSRNECKHLEAKLRAAELRHAKDTAELKNKLESQESVISKMKQQSHDTEGDARKRASQLREADAKLAKVAEELEVERRKRRAEESRHQDQDREKARSYEARIQELRKELSNVRAQDSHAKQAVEEVEASAATEREALQSQLQHVRDVMVTVAEQYGHLVSAMQRSARATSLERAKADATCIRLEGVVADREGRIRNLANALQLQDEATTALLMGLRDYDSLVRSILRHRSLSVDSPLTPQPTPLLDFDLTAELTYRDQLLDVERQTRAHVEEGLVSDRRWVEDGYNRLVTEMLEGQMGRDAATEKLAEQEAACLTAQATLEAAEARLMASDESVQRLSSQLSDLKAQMAKSDAEDARIQSAYRAEADKLGEQLKTEKAYSNQLGLDLAHAKAREAALAVDADNLQEGLTDAERYKSEYQALLAEVKIILSRNALAEDEAERLSRFNAEILGHQNPMQKILYVDKIRREMADVKQKLIVSTLERDAAEDDKRKLYEELASYKAVDIPMDTKPRSTMTRVARVPFSSRSVNTLSRSHAQKGISDRIPSDRVPHSRGLTWESENAEDALRVEDLQRA